MKLLRENASGTRTWELSRINEQVVIDFLAKEYNEDLFKVARKARRNKAGKVTFVSGYGYDVVDCDLLGGNGSGERGYKFSEYYKEVTGEWFSK